jgi:glycosyltransferase involved in cell wall biosynthesis
MPVRDQYSILTFNSHQSYVHSMSKTGVKLYVVDHMHPGHMTAWDPAVRPVPPNVRLIDLQTASRMHLEGTLHAVVCHNLSDLMAVASWQLPKVLCIHSTVAGRICSERSRITKEDWLDTFRAYLHTLDDVQLVFVSTKKAADWGMSGTTIRLWVDPEDYQGYNGKIARALTVSNQFKLRGEILGYDFYRCIVGDHAAEILGHNPGIAAARPARSWDELKNKYRHNRVYVYTARQMYEDGYNTALLEAMSTGMPVIAAGNDSSPVVDGVNGFISDDTEILQKRLAFLLQDRSAAAALGRAARRTILERFPREQFVDRWVGLLNRLTG